MGCHPSHWLSYVSEGWLNHQPDIDFMNQYNPHENYSYIYHKPELIQPIQEVVELLEAQCLPVPWPTADTDHGHGDSTRKKMDQWCHWEEFQWAIWNNY